MNRWRPPAVEGARPRVLIVAARRPLSFRVAAALMFDDRVAFLGLVPVRTSAQALTHLAPDVALLELATGEASEWAVRIERRWPHVRVAAICEPLGSSARCATDTAAHDTGVESVLSITAATAVEGAADRRPSLAVRAAALSRREREVAAVLADGYANVEIARRLSIAPATVKNHVHSILTKLGVETRSRVRGLALLDVADVDGMARPGQTTFAPLAAWTAVPVRPRGTQAGTGVRI